MMYAVHTTVDTTNATFFRKKYDQDHLNGLSSSIKKAWNSLNITVSQNTPKTLNNNGRITASMMEAQELALKKIWDTPENDAWDDLYKELNA